MEVPAAKALGTAVSAEMQKEYDDHLAKEGRPGWKPRTIGPEVTFTEYYGRVKEPMLSKNH